MNLPLPSPNINPSLLSVDCCWVGGGGVGVQLLSNFFSKIFVVKLDMLLICKCSLSASVYGNFLESNIQVF